MPGTAGFHARTHSRGPTNMQGSYKTSGPRLGLDAGDGVSAPGGPVVGELVGAVSFGFVISVTPGPNNSVLWASGLRFGFQRTVPHVLGTAAGIGAMVLGVAAGIGVLLDAVPGVELGLK